MAWTEGNPDAWKGEDGVGTFTVGHRYLFSQHQRGMSLKLLSFANNIPVFAPNPVQCERTFSGGRYMGKPEECDWIPPRTREILDQQDYPILVFVGNPVDERQLYCFCIEMPNGLGDTEIIPEGGK